MGFDEKLQRNLEEILLAGAALELTVTGKLPGNLIDLAKCARRGESHLTLTGSSGLLHSVLIDIAGAGRGHVTFKD